MDVVHEKQEVCLRRLPSTKRVRRGSVIFLSAVSRILFLPLMGSCDNRRVEVYEVPKEKTTMESPRDHLVPSPPSPSEAVKWRKPDGWREKPAKEMRQGSFDISDRGQIADVSVISFPGDAGGLESNVNRWREQVNEPVLGSEDLRKSLIPLTVNGMPGYMVDVQTPTNAAKPSRIIGAILQNPGRAWFVKMMGPPDLLEKQKDQFLGFVRSFEFKEQENNDAKAESSRPSMSPGSSPRTKSTND
jgi:hypothetical protein